MSLHIRISDTDLCFASYESGRPPQFDFERVHLRPQVSLTVNLREAMGSVTMLQREYKQVEVSIVGRVTPVPLAEFQEEDVETLYSYCFTPGEKSRRFYDVAPATNAVLLFSLSEMTCRVLEEAFGEVRYSSAMTSLLQHFAGKGIGSANGRRLFVYTHDGVIDLVCLDEMRLVMINTYPVRTLTDVDYYTFNMARHLGIDLQEAPIFVAGEALLRDPVVTELQKYAARVYAVNPSAEYNRHLVSTTEGVPYDFMCSLLKKQ